MRARTDTADAPLVDPAADGRLFDTTPENIVIHLRNIFEDIKLEETATAKDFLVVQTEGKRQVRRNLKHYNLDAIISVGYRVIPAAGCTSAI